MDINFLISVCKPLTKRNEMCSQNSRVAEMLCKRASPPPLHENPFSIYLSRDTATCPMLPYLRC